MNESRHTYILANDKHVKDWCLTLSEIEEHYDDEMGLYTTYEGVEALKHIIDVIDYAHEHQKMHSLTQARIALEEMVGELYDMMTI